ncbi:hypothetical protein ACQPZP_20875 [Spirillospora sp. CA-142024]
MRNTQGASQEEEPQEAADQPEEPLRDPLEVGPNEVNLDPHNPFGQ